MAPSDLPDGWELIRPDERNAHNVEMIKELRNYLLAELDRVTGQPAGGGRGGDQSPAAQLAKVGDLQSSDIGLWDCGRQLHLSTVMTHAGMAKVYRAYATTLVDVIQRLEATADIHERTELKNYLTVLRSKPQ